MKSIKTNIRIVITSLFFLGACLAYGDTTQPVLTSIKTETLPSDSVRMQLHFTQPSAKPAVFATQNPAMIIMDFKNAGLNLNPATKTLPVGPLTKYEAVQAEDKTRVVFYLQAPAKYTVTTKDSDVYLTLYGNHEGSKVKREVFAPKKTAASTRPSQDKHSVKKIDFNRSESGAGQITVDLSDPNVNINLLDKAGLITVSLDNTQLPSYLQRKFDVTAFGTAVQFIEAVNRGKQAVLSILAKPPYQHMAYQVNNKFIIDVKGIGTASAPGQINEPKKYTGKSLSLNFQNIPVRSALQLLAQFSGTNVVVSDSVTGNITLRLHEIPWDQALDIILQTRGLGKRQIGDTYIIAPADELARREREELMAQQQVQGLEPLHSELIQINYGKAAEIAQLLQGKGKSVLSERGSVSVDARTNTLWVQDTPQKLAEIRKLVQSLDVPVRQVLIEARIVNVDKNYEREFGIRWGISKPSSLSGTLEGASQTANGTPISEVDVAKRLNVDLPASGVGTPGGAASVGIALAKLGGGVLLDLELSALQTEGDAKIIASPRLITANQKEAIIESGEEVPYPESTSSGATSVAFKKATLSLKVTPQITPDDRLVLDITVNQNKIGSRVFNNVPTLDTREVQTQVLVNNGQTIVLGGIYQQSTNNNVERVPFLGDLPLVGNFFRHTKKAISQGELLVFITPRIIKQSLYQGE